LYLFREKNFTPGWEIFFSLGCKNAFLDAMEKLIKIGRIYENILE